MNKSGPAAIEQLVKQLGNRDGLARPQAQIDRGRVLGPYQQPAKLEGLVA